MELHYIIWPVGISWLIILYFHRQKAINQRAQRAKEFPRDIFPLLSTRFRLTLHQVVVYFAPQSGHNFEVHPSKILHLKKIKRPNDLSEEQQYANEIRLVVGSHINISFELCTNKSQHTRNIAHMLIRTVATTSSNGGPKKFAVSRLITRPHVNELRLCFSSTWVRQC